MWSVPRQFVQIEFSTGQKVEMSLDEAETLAKTKLASAAKLRQTG